MAQIKRKMIFCEPCSFKMILEAGTEPEGLVKIPTAPIPGGVPELDPKTGTTKVKAAIQQSPRYKCPKCGRGVVLKDLQQAYTKTFKQIDERAERQKLEADRQKRLEDGKPLSKDVGEES